MVAIHFQGMPPLGGREGSPLSCGLAFSLFESHGCVRGLRLEIPTDSILSVSIGCSCAFGFFGILQFLLR